MSRIRSGRLSAIALAGLLALGALALGASSSRADPPTPPYLDPAYEDALWSRVSFTGSGWPATYPAGWAAPDAYEVSVAAGALPPLRAVGTLWLDTTPFDVGWKINRTIDTKWLHLSGDIGTDSTAAENVRWRWGQWCGPCPEAWTLMMNTTMGTLEFCNQCATRDQAGWDQQQAILDLYVGATEFIRQPSACGIQQGVCRIVVMTEQAMVAALIHSAPETYMTQPFGYSSTIPAPVKNATNLTAARNKITELGELIQNEYNASLDSSWPRPSDDSFLLERYAPELRYDSLEGFRADSAAEMTDNDPPGIGSYNELLDGDGALIATAEPFEGFGLLRLDFLGNSYPDPWGPTDEAHKIDALNSYQADFERMHPLSEYRNKMYGRVDSFGGYTILQYWFFYYYNSKEFGAGLGPHEGDWEMVEILLNPDGTPSAAAYSQHEYGETCGWQQVERTADGRAVVYVAEGSHASYFHESSGAGYPVHILDGGGPPVFVGFDTADGANEHATPTVIDITDPPDWLSWPGRWGEDTGASPVDSPRSPKYQGDKWDAPGAWALSDPSLVQCRSGSSFRSSQAVGFGAVNAAKAEGLPPVPVVKARIQGKRAIIDYRFRSFPTQPSRRPWILITSVVPSNPKYAQYTVRSRITTRSGRVVQRLSRGPGPYELRVAALSKLGTRSKVLRLPLR